MAKITTEHFWQTIILYLTRPNLINRRYIGAQCIKYWNTRSVDLPIKNIEWFECWSKFTITELKNKLALETRAGLPTVAELIDCRSAIVVLRKLFRKQSLKSLQNKDNTEPDIEYDCVIFYPYLLRFSVVILDGVSGNGDSNSDDEQQFSLHAEQYSYGMNFILSQQKLEIDYLFGTESIASKTTYWLESVLRPKLERWIEMSSETEEKGDSASTNNQIHGSITKISIEIYCSHYNRLKSKYSIELLQIWKTLEKTDPLKFIFEDIAIASYLLTLWSEERDRCGFTEKQSFVDVGCGNGLLVYILTQEGHPGCGIDVRRRTIWDHYGTKVNLIEEQIDPLDQKSIERIPKVDWMIGNHSDELTPWILMLSAKISFKMRIFLLPCCPFDFDGLKFQRTAEESKSQYQGYMDYLMELGEKFGFRVWKDKLRIPSTKRTCIVGYDRQLPEGKSFNTISQQEAEILLKDYDDSRENIVQERLKSRVLTMKLRQQEIVVRNCTRIDPEIRQRMIDKIVKLLLQNEKITFAQILSQFRDPEIVSAMKNQCGGIQTFIRNHKYIFTIQNSKIQFQTADALRIPKGQEDREKIRLCWFKQNHPNGCPLSPDDCRYKH